VEENSAALTVVGVVSASDPDAGDVLGYAITAGNVGSAFAINPLTGQITVAGALDFESQAQYVLTVTVTDDADPALSDTATITIDLTDVNEAPLAVDAGFSVAENSAALTVVGTVAASDPDAGDVLGYAITTGNVGSAFAIDPLTGEITVAGTLDFETLAEYILTITVTDDADPALSDTATVSITVIPAPVNDYIAWKAEFGITDGPGVDSDGDSISNIIEYIIGGDPADQMDAALLPSVQLVTADPDGDLTTSDYLLFTHRRTVRAANNPAVGIKVEWSTDLAAWQNAEGAGVVIDDVSSVELVKVYIPRSLHANGKLFARLGASVATP
jgi:hypothetical protein